MIKKLLSILVILLLSATLVSSQQQTLVVGSVPNWLTPGSDSATAFRYTSVSGRAILDVDTSLSNIYLYNSTGAPNSYVTFDGTNQRIGLGVAIPQAQFDMSGNMRMVTSTLTAGNIYKGTSQFIHNFGPNNTFLGVDSGRLNAGATGGQNTGIGNSSLRNFTSGQNNSTLGYNTGGNISTGSNNVMLGTVSGSSVNTGSGNTFVGASTGNARTTGSGNVEVGYRAGFNQSVGASNNTMIGYEAGFANATGNGSVLLGYQAGYNETNNNRLYINNDSGDPLIGGDFANDKVAINGIADPYGSTFQIRTVTSGNFPNYGVAGGRVLTTDATVTTLYTLTMPDNNVFLVEARVVARCTGGAGGNTGKGASYIIKQAFKRTGGGVATAIGALSIETWEDIAGWDATLDVTGNTVRTRVTGGATDNMTWHVAFITQYLIN